MIADRPPVSPTDLVAETDPVLARIGNTPMVRLNRVLPDDVPRQVEIWAKLEWFNPGGSVKDRAALSMIREAEAAGRLEPGMTILDASSGNTGIALAMVAARRGYRLVLCLPENANADRKQRLRAYGAEIVLTSPFEGSDGAIIKARELAHAHPDYLYLDQYSNPANWRAHLRTTGPEIWRDTNGQITHFVACLGTSGTFVGTSRYLKSRDAGVRCVSVQPDDAMHGLEGLKHMESALVPDIYDPELADADLGAPTETSINYARRLGDSDGLLAGISAGAAVWGAVEVARRIERGIIVTVFPDGADRYFSDRHVWG
ncbi:MAG: cysteine synthase family protein [Myxococcales bacterium FL481]|nr:MAG: cysteine synthase family protein [Myxococcales bacterium FL481]